MWQSKPLRKTDGASTVYAPLGEKTIAATGEDNSTVTLEARMAQAGTIEVELDDNGVIIVRDEVTLCYGVAPTFVEAVGDYYTTLKDWVLLTAGDKA